MSRAVFLDRDGVINSKAPEGDYITEWRRVSFLPGVAGAVSRFQEAGFLVVVVSNQRAIAKGLLTEAGLEQMHGLMWRTLFRDGKGPDAVYYCPHDKVPACGCRKPEPGLILKAARDHGIDLAASWMIGDAESDVEAGRRANCRTIRIATASVKSSADEIARSLAEAADFVLAE